jgi:hypothetical protein
MCLFWKENKKQNPAGIEESDVYIQFEGSDG